MKNKILHFLLLISKRTIPLDFFSKRFPISIKGIIISDDEKILLLKNEREEWDLPGGKLKADISAEACLLREVKEETNLKISIEGIRGTNVYKVFRWIKVFVVYYECHLVSSKSDLEISGEHFGVGFFSIDEVRTLKMYEGYRQAILHIMEQKKRQL